MPQLLPQQFDWNAYGVEDVLRHAHTIPKLSKLSQIRGPDLSYIMMYRDASHNPIPPRTLTRTTHFLLDIRLGRGIAISIRAPFVEDFLQVVERGERAIEDVCRVQQFIVARWSIRHDAMWIQELKEFKTELTDNK